MDWRLWILVVKWLGRRRLKYKLMNTPFNLLMR
jgi:hypothetical protein